MLYLLTFPKKSAMRLVLLTLTCLTCSVAKAQISPALELATPKKAPASKEEKRSVSEWRKDVKRRLAEAEAMAAKLEAEEDTQPSAILLREVELLTRIETVLSQLAAEEEDTKKLERDHNKDQAELDDFIQHGFGEGKQISFLQLDEERDDLQDEQRRMNRFADKKKSADAALDLAEIEQKKHSSQRRQLLEKVENNNKNDLRQTLGEQLAEAMLASEATEATAALRKQEAENSSQQAKLKQLRIQLLKERIARMQSKALFGSSEINELYEGLDRQEDNLESDIAEVEANETKLKYLEDQWIRTQRKFDESSGNKEALREEIAAHQIGRRVIQERLPILQKQVERLTGVRKAWKHRQEIFNNIPTRDDLRAWTIESEQSLGQLRREERTTIFEIEELGAQLGPLKERQEKGSAESPEAYWVKQQITNLNLLLESLEQNLNSIRTSIKLQSKLLDELKSDSLADTAKERLEDLWGIADSVWNYELASFEKKSVTVRKVVTALLILIVGMYLSRVLSRALRKQVLRRLDVDPSASATIQSLFYYTLLLMFGFFALNVAKVPLTAFTLLGGAVALGIGFGSQNIINNFISGLVLMAERPVKVGDLVQIDDLYGNIEHIGARSTRIRTGGNLDIIVPNSVFLQSNVINFTLSSNKVRTSVEVGVAYGSPTVTVTQLLRRAAVETGRVAKDPPPIILFKNFGDNSLVFEVFFWLHMRTMMDQLQIESSVRFRIDQLFREEGVSIAFPQQDVHLDASSPIKVQMVEE